MPAPSSPREVFERLTHGIATWNLAQLPDLYAEDCLVEHPFAPPGPARRIEGRAAIRRHFAQAADGPLRMRPGVLAIHETTDPEVVIGEVTQHFRMLDTGREFTADAIFVLRVRGGLIVTSRDYANHLSIAHRAGWLPQLIEALDAESGATGLA
ncbi:nuclear transport factor 2 family protein [Micromonospora zhanjiangensis]|uniref:Nuclear transport factor 2 family protein n=1 Tax=Micromonospora zhanjiangensis TaxID=1522057 RepID=A0ABV8KQE3_9ACTN